MECRVQTVRINELHKWYQPDEVLGYCSRCPNHEKFWSCPPHGFSVEKYLEPFQFATIVGVRIYPDKNSSQDDVISCFHRERRLINEKMLTCESICEGSRALISGHCHFCETCPREKGEACVKPEKMRYSLESLGYKVSEITKEVLQEELQWAKGKSPEYLLAVTALLSEKPLDETTIIEHIDCK